MSRLAISLLGSPQIQLNGVPVKLERNKGVALLAYLAVTERAHHRDTLADLLWPEYERTKARATFRVTFSQLKKTIGVEWFTSDQDILSLDIRQGIWLDVAHFSSLLAECRGHGHSLKETCNVCIPILIEAVSLYRGTFLAGFTLHNSAVFDMWQQEQSDWLQLELAEALEGLIWRHHQDGQLETAIRYARRWLSWDPLQEIAYKCLLQLYLDKGESVHAARLYEEYVRLLASELQLPPSLEMQALYHSIANYEPVRAPTSSAPAIDRKASNYSKSTKFATSQDSNSAIPHNLPNVLTPFFGRKAEITQITGLLDNPQCRLLTLVGSGGVGKSRLALQTAREHLRRAEQKHDDFETLYVHGIYFIPLAPTSSTTAMVSTIAHFLGVSFYSGDDIQVQLLNYLRQKQMLLVLDNFEQLVSEIKFLLDLLVTAPQVKLLITSRERLKLPEEWLFHVEGLDYPKAPTLDGQKLSLLQYSAIEMFLQRAQRVHTRFSLTHKNAEFVLQICQLLEGNPLGIELAAALMRLTTCQDLEKKISQSIEILKSISTDMPERHRSLYATFEHSWYLLKRKERTVLRRLSVFQGGFTLEAASSITNASLHILAELLDKSLLQRDEKGRFSLHETLRQYLGEKLELNPAEKIIVLERYCMYFADFIDHQAEDLQAGQQIEAAKTLINDLHNIRNTWNYAVETRQIMVIDKLAEPLCRLYTIYSLSKEGYTAFSLAIEALATEESCLNQYQLLLGRLSVRKASFCFGLSRHDEALSLCKKSREIFENCRDLRELALVHNLSGVLSLVNGRLDEAKSNFHQCLQLAKESDQFRLAFNAISNLGIVANWRGDKIKAQQLLESAIASRRRIGDWLGTSNDLLTLAQVKVSLGEYEEAQQLCYENIKICSKIHYRLGLARIYSTLSGIAWELGIYEEARCKTDQALALSVELGYQFGVVDALSAKGYDFYLQNKLVQSKKYYLEALKIAHSIGAVPYITVIVSQIAALLYKVDKKSQALALLIIVRPCFVGENHYTKMAEQLYSTLCSELLSESIHEEKSECAQTNLEEIVATLLSEGIDFGF